MKTQTVTLYHNPRCSKSRQALEIIKARKIEPEIVEYLQNPPNLDTLQNIIALLGVEAEELIRKNESVFKAMKITESEFDSNQWLELLLKNPILLQRPIIVTQDKATIGRPPERVNQLLDTLNK